MIKLISLLTITDRSTTRGNSSNVQSEKLGSEDPRAARAQYHKVKSDRYFPSEICSAPTSRIKAPPT